MDLHQLYVFTKVVENKSFSKAAEEIFLSQSTVSAHIHSLEKILNMKLFDRVGRESILTPNGEKLYYWAQQLLLLKDQALLDLNENMNKLSGVIRMGASSVPGSFIVPKMISQFKKRYPGASFHVTESSSKIVSDKVLNGGVDIGIIGEKYEHERLHFIPLLKEQLVLITESKLELKEPVNLREILKHPFVMRSPDSGTYALLERLLRQNSIPKEDLNISAYTDSGQSLIHFVKQGIGISIISQIAAEEYAKTGIINMYQIEDVTDQRFFYLVFNKQRTFPLITKLFIGEAENLM